MMYNLATPLKKKKIAVNLTAVERCVLRLALDEDRGFGFANCELVDEIVFPQFYYWRLS